MTISLEMHRAARRGARSLTVGKAATIAFVADHFTSQGFRGRSGQGDLYYTVFGLELLLALEGPVPAGPLTEYLESFGSGADLDLVHAACLARCWGALPDAVCGPNVREALADRIVSLASPAGDYGTAYGCFLATLALQDLGRDVPNREGVIDCLSSLAIPDGGFANQPGWPTAAVPSTAAALVALTHLDGLIPDTAVTWLTAQHRSTGGFAVSQSVPEADLLSTAVGLHALAIVGRGFDDKGGYCRDFITNLGRDGGGYVACGADSAADIEYTWYALLAMGNLGG